jgi:hypothetical protein
MLSLADSSLAFPRLILCQSRLELTLYSPFSSLIAGNAEKISCDKPLRINRKEEK